MHQKGALFGLLLVSSLFLTLGPIQPRDYQIQETVYTLEANCDQPYYYVRGETIQARALVNASIPVTLTVYWHWRTFTEHELVYRNTQLANATWNIPTGNAKVGFYQFIFESGNNTVSLWRTLLNVANWQPASLPFQHTWQGINYTFQGRTFTASRGSDYLELTYPKIPFQHSANLYRNNMSFLIRLQGPSWGVDILYFTTHRGLKWRINGTLENPQTFTFQCAHNPLKTWAKHLHSFRGTTLVFDWEDLRKAGKAFSWDSETKILSVTIPSSFDIDPTIFETGFEGGAPEYGDWDSTTVNGDGELWYSQTWAHHGVNSSRHNSSNNGASRNVFARKDEIYDQLNARFYLYIEQIGASSANMQFYYLRAGSWRGFSIGLNTANNNISITWYNSSASQSKILNNYWNLSTAYLVEIEFIRHATNASWTLYIDEVIVNSEQGLHNNWQTEYIQVGHSSNFRSGWTVTYYDCVVLDNAYIGPEISGQDVTFTRVVNLLVWASSASSFEQALLDLTFTLVANLQLYSYSLMTRGLGFLVAETLLLEASQTLQRELGFLASSTLQLWATRLESFQFTALDLAFVVVANMRLWASQIATFQGVSFELAFILYGALTLWAAVPTLIARGLLSNIIMLAGLGVILAIVAIAIAASKRD